MAKPFNKADIESLVKALDALGANSEADGKLPSDVIAGLASPKDDRLMVWLSELDFPGLKKDRELLAPHVDWNRMLLMWLTPAAVGRDVSFTEAPQSGMTVRSKSESGKSVRKPKAGSKLAGGTKKVKRPSKKKTLAKPSDATLASLPTKKKTVARPIDATLASLVANIRKEFGISDKHTLLQTIIEAELQLNIQAKGANIKQRAQTILDLL